MTICYVHNVFEWCARFHDGRQSVGDDVRTGSLHAAMTADNMSRVKNCIFKDRCLKVCDTEVEMSQGVGSVKKIIQYHFKFCKLPARCVIFSSA